MIFVLAAFCLAGSAAMPPLERVLPPETVTLVSVTNYARLESAFRKSTLGRFWDDPAMKPFRDHFIAGWREDFVGPLENLFQLKSGELSECFQDGMALALVGSQDTNNPAGLEMLLMADAAGKAAQAKKLLETTRRKWFTIGRDVSQFKAGEADVVVFNVAATNLPAGFSALLTDSSGRAIHSLALAQSDSLFMLGTSTNVVKRVLQALKGAGDRTLGDVPEFQRGRWKNSSVTSPLSGWISGRALFEGTARAKVTLPKAGAAEDQALDFGQVLEGAGIQGIEGIDWTVEFTSNGIQLRTFLASPAAARQGLLRLVTGKPAETVPPDFVPAAVEDFWRLRADGRQAWAVLEQTITRISAQWMSAIKFILETANQAGKLKDPSFDVSTNIVANLGDDVVHFTLPPEKNGPNAAGASVYAISSPNPSQLAASLGHLLIFFAQKAEPPAERDYQGSRIWSMPLAPVFASTGVETPPVLHYTAGTNYVVFSTDPRLLEQYLDGKFEMKLASSNYLATAFARISGSDTLLLGCVAPSQMETLFNTEPGPVGAQSAQGGLSSMVPLLPGVITVREGVRSWVNPALLPRFEPIKRYFGPLVYALSADTDGFTVKIMLVPPPGADYN